MTEFPTLTQSTVWFPEPGGGLRCEFYEKDAVDEIAEASNRSVGEWLAFMGLCWDEE